MRYTAKNFLTAASVALITGTISLMPAIVQAGAIEDGKKIAFHKKKGNCLSCHLITGGKLPGNIGPPLVSMKARFPNKADLRAQIVDARAKNPNTMMPPFGTHEILSNKEIDKVVEFIYSL